MTRPTLPDVDLAKLAAYTAGVTRAVTEYRVLPAAPPGHIAAPCVTGCGRTARTTRGVCRHLYPFRGGPVNRRLPHDRPTPKLTRGDEQPRAACRDDMDPFDQMAEHRDTTRDYALARIEAARVCGGCGLRATCDFKVVAA